MSVAAAISTFYREGKHDGQECLSYNFNGLTFQEPLMKFHFV